MPRAAAWAWLIIGLLNIAGVVNLGLRTRWFCGLAEYPPGTVVSAPNTAALVVGILPVLQGMVSLPGALQFRSPLGWRTSSPSPCSPLVWSPC
jgi:hypothetical protein